MKRPAAANMATVAALVRWVHSAAPSVLGTMAGLTALYALSTAISLVSLVPMLALLGIGGGKVGNWGTRFAEWLMSVGFDPSLPLVLGAYFLAVSVGIGARLLMARQTSRLRETCLLGLRQETYRSLLATRWQAQALISDADCSQVLTEEAGHFALMIEFAVSAVLDVSLLSVLFVAGLWLSWPVAFAGLLGGVAIFAGLTPFRRKVLVAAKAHNQEAAAFYRDTAALLAGRKQVLALGRQNESFQDLSLASDRLGASHDRMRRIEAGTRAGLDIGMELLLVLLVAGFVLWVHAPSATLFLLLYCAGRGLQVLGRAHASWAGFLTLLPVFGRIQALLAELREEADRHLASDDAKDSGGDHQGAYVDVADVEVTYAGQARPAITGVTLAIAAGEMVALVGPSGSGKTTLADVCAGIIGPDRGACRRFTPSGTPARIAYVGQEGGLFPLTIRGNLLWHQPGASEEECWAAIDKAQAGFVRDLPEGLDTAVGTTRARFSTGEQKRLLLACALIRQPSLLVLDETTSQLDAETEAGVIAALAGLRMRCTIVLVTHSLAAAQACDRIVVMDQGRVAQIGGSAALAWKADFFKSAGETQSSSAKALSA